MKIIKNIILTQEQTQPPLGLRKICRVIRDNIKVDKEIERLGNELNLQPDAGKLELHEAYNALKRRLPYYSVAEDNPNQVIPIKLVKTRAANLYKVLPETNIISLLHTMINDNESKGVILPISKFVYRNDNYIRKDHGDFVNFCKFHEFSDLNQIYFDDNEYWSRTMRHRFLMDKQLTNVPIFSFIECSEAYSVEEKIVHLYTMQLPMAYRMVIMESSSITNATYIFKIVKRMYGTAIKIIMDYFGSKQLTKRSRFLETDEYFSQENGFISRRKIIHKNLLYWMKEIELIHAGIEPYKF